MEEELIEGGGMSMVIKENTHQEVRRGKKCRARCIDHIYCNAAERLKNTQVIAEGGSHHRLLKTTLMERLELKGPQQHEARLKKGYGKEELLYEMDKFDWSFSKLQGRESREIKRKCHQTELQSSRVHGFEMASQNSQ